MIDPFRLLATTFFANPSVNQQVKDGSISSLPSVFGIPGISGAPQFPSSDPGTTPVLPSFDIPPSILAWVGTSHAYPQSPAVDPFYKPALSTYQNKNNGDVLAIRPVGLNALFPEVATSWQILYRTESATGTPTADVTTLLIPRNYDGKHLISWQDWEDSNNVKCAPSYLFTAGLRDPTIDLLLSQGWAANVPDHEGVNSAFAVGYKSGKSTLDSIRAVKQASQQIKFSYNDLVLYGYSGGSIATEFALELQPTYAPDVQIKAASFGGVIASLNETLFTINKSLFAGFAFAGLYGLATEYGFYDLLQQFLKDDSRARANMVLDHCFTWDLLNYPGHDLFAYMKNGESVISDPTVNAILEKEKMGSVAPQVPVYIHQGAADQIAPVSLVDNLVDFYCENGVLVDYERDDGIDHVFEMVVGIGNAIKFFQKVFNEDYKPSQCASHQDALQNNNVRSPATDNKVSQAKALAGDYSDFGI